MNNIPEDNGDHREQGIIPRPMRADYRVKQIKTIVDKIMKKYLPLIKSATTRNNKDALKVRRDAEIAKAVEPLKKDQKLDTPEFL